MAPTFIIYGLFDPRDQQLRYVGKTEGALKTRLQHHVHRARAGKSNTHKTAWIRQLLASGLLPEIAALENRESHEALVEAEVWNIQYYRSLGCRLTNGTVGGEGCLGYRHTPEARARMSAAKKGKRSPNVGRAHSLESKLAVSRTKTGLTSDQQREAVALYGSGLSARKAAKVLGVSEQCVRTLVGLLGGNMRGFGPVKMRKTNV